MEIVKKLNKALLHKNPDGRCLLNTEDFKNIAEAYTRTENCIAVLSDMQYDKSYIFSSKTSLELGLNFHNSHVTIDSIWEEEMLKKIHPDDRMKKYVHELRFFRFLESVNIENRSEFSVFSKIRMQDKKGIYQWIRHRMFYFFSPYNRKLRFALCLYDIEWDQSALSSRFLIINTVKGKVALEDKMDYNNILSPREMEILKQIGEGLTSKEIADVLSISIHTVNRHRQNILEKLKVKNSVSAFNEVMDKFL